MHLRMFVFTLMAALSALLPSLAQACERRTCDRCRRGQDYRMRDYGYGSPDYRRDRYREDSVSGRFYFERQDYFQPGLLAPGFVGPYAYGYAQPGVGYGGFGLGFGVRIPYSTSSTYYVPPAPQPSQPVYILPQRNCPPPQVIYVLPPSYGGYPGY